MKNSTARRFVLYFSLASYVMQLLCIFLIIREFYAASVLILAGTVGFQIPIITLSIKEAVKDKNNVFLIKKK